MTSQTLREARKYEEASEKLIKAEERPGFHLTPRTGWMNDPNGFSYYKGRYHLFYQYYPYESRWGSMHWGHAVSQDLLHWESLPCAMAPAAANAATASIINFFMGICCWFEILIPGSLPGGIR